MKRLINKIKELFTIENQELIQLREENEQLKKEILEKSNNIDTIETLSKIKERLRFDLEKRKQNLK